MSHPIVSRTSLRAGAFAAALTLAGVGPSAHAGGGATIHDIDFFFESLSFGGDAAMPLGAGLGNVDSRIRFTMVADPVGGGLASGNTRLAENCISNCGVLDPGENLFVESFFDVFFDITIEDIDPQNNFAGYVDGSIIHLGAGLRMGDNPFVPQCHANLAQAFDGCGMLMGASAFDDYDSDEDLALSLGLGADVTGDSVLDAITMTPGVDFLQIQFSDPLSTVVAGGVTKQTYAITSVLWQFTINPPFSIGELTGNAVVTTQADPGLPAPEPAALLLLGTGLGLLGLSRALARRRAR